MEKVGIPSAAVNEDAIKKNKTNVKNQISEFKISQ